MHNELSQDDVPHAVDGDFTVTSNHVGKSLVARFRHLFPSGKIQSSDFYVNQSRNVYQQHRQFLPPEDQAYIISQFDMSV